MKKTRYYYKDFVTGEQRFTRAPFAGWTERTGPLNAHYAMFARRTEMLFVPEYLLSKDTRAALPALSKEEGS